MDDRTLVTRILELGVAARRINPRGYARPAEEPDFENVGNATLANWLGKLGGCRMVADVQPCFTSLGPGFEFRLTDEAISLVSDRSRLSEWLDTIVPSKPEFDIFISYSTGDAGLADELRTDLVGGGLTCFMAEKDVQIATEFQDSILQALIGSEQILVLLTPRSIQRPWILMEMGAAWALRKPLIPALSHVALSDLPDPIKRYEGRVIETTAQRRALVAKLIRGPAKKAPAKKAAKKAPAKKAAKKAPAKKAAKKAPAKKAAKKAPAKKAAKKMAAKKK
jgi:TIR domain